MATAGGASIGKAVLSRSVKNGYTFLKARSRLMAGRPKAPKFRPKAKSIEGLKLLPEAVKETQGNLNMEGVKKNLRIYLGRRQSL
jgi:hypothetical protein